MYVVHNCTQKLKPTLQFKYNRLTYPEISNSVLTLKLGNEMQYKLYLIKKFDTHESVILDEIHI